MREHDINKYIRKMDYDTFYRNWLNNVGNSGEDKIRRIYEGISLPSESNTKIEVKYDAHSDMTCKKLTIAYKLPYNIYISSCEEHNIMTGYELLYGDIVEPAIVKINNRTRNDYGYNSGDIINIEYEIIFVGVNLLYHHSYTDEISRAWRTKEILIK